MLGFNEGSIKFEDAIIQLETMKKTFATFKNHPYYFDLYRYIAFCYLLTKNNKLAISTCKEGYDRCGALKGIAYDTLFLKFSSELAYYYSFSAALKEPMFNQFKISYNHLQKNPWLKNKIPNDIVAFYINYSIAFQRQGDKEQYFLMLLQAWNIAKNIKYDVSQYSILSNLSTAYREKGDYKNSLYHANLALKYATTPNQFAQIYYTIGATQKQQNHDKEALASFYKSLNYIKNTPALWVELVPSVKTYMGEIYLKNKQYNLARKFLSEAIQSQKKLIPSFKGFRFAKIYLALGDVELASNNTQKALLYYQKAIIASHDSFLDENFSANPAYDKGLSFPVECVMAMSKKAQLLAFNNPQMALNTSILAIKYASTIRKSFQFQESKLLLSATTFSLFSTALETAHTLWNSSKNKSFAEDFFFILEAANASTLLDIANEQSIRNKNLNPEFTKKEKALKNIINDLQTKLTTAKLGDEYDKLQAQIATLNTELNFLNKDFEKKSATYQLLKYQNNLVSLFDVQKKLDANTSLLCYFVDEHFLYSMAVSNNNYLLSKQAIIQPLRQAVNTLYQEISSPPSFEPYNGHALAKQVYNYLLQPYQNILAKSKNLLVIRNNFLSLRPFEVLEKNGNADFLIKNYSFAYLNSATAYFLSSQNKQPSNNILAFAPFNKFDNTIRRSGFPALDASENEVASITHDYFLGNLANKNTFLQNYQQANIIHLATHAQINDEFPDKSFVSFYPENKNARIFLPEIYGLDLANSKLVVLSACETANGKMIKGEGLLSIARAFQYAGCPSVIATFWSADDKATATLSQLTYLNIEKGMPLNLALQNAKIQLLESKKFAAFDHPFYWSNFLLFGQANSLNISLPSQHHYGLVACIVVVVLMVVVFYFREKLFKRLF